MGRNHHSYVSVPKLTRMLFKKRPILEPFPTRFVVLELKPMALHVLGKYSTLISLNHRNLQLKRNFRRYLIPKLLF